MNKHKKPPVSRFSKPNGGSRSPIETWHNGGDTEIHFSAQSLEKAARALVGKLELDQNARTDWDACPVILLYRQALELYLKAVVGEGSNFLKSRTDPISLFRSHSIRWLAQIVCQIIKAVGWENDFTCEGVTSLADFSAVVNEVEILDPVMRAVHSSTAGGKDSVSPYYRAFNAAQFARRMNGLLNLLDVTADALAAMWDERAEVMAADAELSDGGDFDPTIQ
jgi:hypothetical protein